MNKPEETKRRQQTRRQFGAGSLGGISILLAGCLGSDDHDNYTVAIIDRDTDEEVADFHGHWHGELPSIQLGKHVSIGADFEDEDGETVSLAEYEFDADIADGEELISTESHGDHVHIHGEETGGAAVVFQLIDGDTVEWETDEPIEVEVTATDD